MAGSPDLRMLMAGSPETLWQELKRAVHLSSRNDPEKNRGNWHQCKKKPDEINPKSVFKKI